MKYSFTPLIFIAIFLMFSCNLMDVQDPKSDSISYLALGDSYTIGQGINLMDNWPNQLVNELNKSGFDINPPTIIAKTGWTTSGLINAIESNDPEKHDLVSLLIGVNNQYQNLSFSKFKTEFISLLNIANSKLVDTSNLFVVSIPDYGVTPFGEANAEEIARELDDYNTYMHEQCLLRSIPFINITKISRELGGSSIALAPDKLHPSGFQYAKWVEKIIPQVMLLLE